MFVGQLEVLEILIQVVKDLARFPFFKLSVGRREWAFFAILILALEFSAAFGFELFRGAVFVATTTCRPSS